MTTWRWVFVALVCVVGWAPGAALAVPPGVPYSGYLEDAAGTPYEGALDVEATLFDVADGGDALWGPVVLAGVTAVGGHFEVVLDDAGAPLGEALAGLGDAYFAFRVKPAGEDWIALEGMQRLGSVAFAHHAGNAERLGGVDAAEFLTSDEIAGTYAKASDLAAVATSGDYADLTNRPDLSGYALTADLAGVCFSGSYNDLVGEPDLSVFVTIDALAAVATTGSYADLTNRPDLSVYALTSNLSVVATTGQYADLLGKPDLSVYAPLSSLATVAMSGSYFDVLGAPDPDALVWRDGSKALTGDLDLAGHALKNAALHPSADPPSDPVVGQLWFDTATQVLRVYTDARWQGISGSVSLPPDGLSTVSNGTLTNVFTAGGTSTDVPIDIPDNYPPGVVASLTIDDSGTLRSLSVHVAITHPEATELRLVLTAPGGEEFVLHDSGAGTSGGLDATWPPTALVTGDFAVLVGTSPAGAWTLSVADVVYSGGAPGDIAGQMTDFSVTYEVLRDDEVAVNGTLTVNGEDVAGELASLQTELAQLQETVAESWCAVNCGPETTPNECVEARCDGASRACAFDPVPDGTACSLGHCSNGACVCGSLGTDCPPSFECTNDEFCENAATGEIWVPAGDFWMGCNAATEQCQPDADYLPQHLVTLDSYAVDRHEITSEEYGACVAAGACQPPNSGSLATYGQPAKAQHPVNYVNWAHADTYCAWSGKPQGVQRLCTEAEWERAARGGCETITGNCVDGMRAFPWGEDDPTPELANYGGNVGETTVVGTYSPAGDSPYGAQDMGGNVWEWVRDWYGVYPDYPVTNPTGPGTGTYHILRGGHWGLPASGMRTSGRVHPPSYAAYDVGFRCCRTIVP
ncbi:MAG: hypothetical protein EP329_25820 [Deltaproteobacteria bacterium]|nr:MAG: hypothetical protein EP329_25820 [Deltaproteobacteria bacterium]